MRGGSSQISELLHLCKRKLVLRWPVLLQGCWEQFSLKWLGQGVLEISQRLGWLGAGRNQPNVLFFLWVREFFLLPRMVGRTWRSVLTPGYLEPRNFPSSTMQNESHKETDAIRKIRWDSECGEGNGTPTPVLLPGKSCGRGSLVGCRL